MQKGKREVIVVENPAALVLKIFFGLIPAGIASHKGRKFAYWWLYASIFPILSFFHSLMIDPEPEPQTPQSVVVSVSNPVVKPTEPQMMKSDAEIIRDYKRLKDDGIITEAEFEEKKKKILNQ